MPLRACLRPCRSSLTSDNGAGKSWALAGDVLSTFSTFPLALMRALLSFPTSMALEVGRPSFGEDSSGTAKGASKVTDLRGAPSGTAEGSPSVTDR